MTDEAGGRRPPTSVDVARRAGVSRSAVSQILNGHGQRFPVETRDRVLAAAAELAYRPSRVGRALVNGVTDFVVVVLPHTTFFGLMLQDCVDTISERAAAAGLTVFIRYAGSDPAATMSAILDLRPTAVVDFAVFGDDERTNLRAAGIAVTPTTGRSAMEQLNHAIGRLQVRRLLRVSQRHIAYALLADDRLDPFGPQRLRGVTEATEEAGVAPPTVLRIPLDLRGAVSALSSMAAESASSLGICCYNDDVAIAVLAAAHELSLAVPEEVAVIGVDNTSIGQLARPRLTTVAINLPAVSLGLVDGLELPTLEPMIEPTDPDRLITLVVGESA